MKIDKQLAAIQGMDAKARASLRINIDRWLTSGTVSQKADAAAVLAGLDSQEAAEHDARQTAPLAELVRKAFTAEPSTATDCRVLQALVDHPGKTSEELSAASGWKKASAWHLHFGKMCERRKAWLPDPEYVEARKGYFYTGLLADLDQDNCFTIKPEAAQALASLGIVKAAAA